MSKRNIRDWMSRAFFAKDKATFARIADEAEQDVTLARGQTDPNNGNGNGNGNGVDPNADPNALTGHAEPDGDEGKHPQNVHIHVEHQGESGGSGAPSLGDRVAKLEDGVKGINDKLSRVLDALPDFIKGKDNRMMEEGECDDAEGTRDSDWGGDVTQGGSDKDGKTDEGGLTMGAPPSSSAELVEADPALGQEKTRMGDAALKSRTIQAMGNVMRDTISRAEIMAPGIKVGTLDAGGVDKWQETQKRLHTFRRSALKKLMATEQGKTVLGPYALTADKLSYDATRLIFNDASEKVRAENNQRNVPSPMFGDGAVSFRAYRNHQEAVIGGINDANHDYWSKQGVAMGPRRRRAA